MSLSDDAEGVQDLLGRYGSSKTPEYKKRERSLSPHEGSSKIARDQHSEHSGRSSDLDSSEEEDLDKEQDTMDADKAGASATQHTKSSCQEISPTPQPPQAHSDSPHLLRSLQSQDTLHGDEDQNVPLSNLAPSFEDESRRGDECDTSGASEDLADGDDEQEKKKDGFDLPVVIDTHLLNITATKSKAALVQGSSLAGRRKPTRPKRTSLFEDDVFENPAPQADVVSGVQVKDVTVTETATEEQEKYTRRKEDVNTETTKEETPAERDFTKQPMVHKTRIKQMGVKLLPSLPVREEESNRAQTSKTAEQPAPSIDQGATDKTEQTELSRYTHATRAEPESSDSEEVQVADERADDYHPCIAHTGVKLLPVMPTQISTLKDKSLKHDKIDEEEDYSKRKAAASTDKNPDEEKVSTVNHNTQEIYAAFQSADDTKKKNEQNFTSESPKLKPTTTTANKKNKYDQQTGFESPYPKKFIPDQNKNNEEKNTFETRKLKPVSFDREEKKQVDTSERTFEVPNIRKKTPPTIPKKPKHGLQKGTFEIPTLRKGSLPVLELKPKNETESQALERPKLRKASIPNASTELSTEKKDSKPQWMLDTEARRKRTAALINVQSRSRKGSDTKNELVTPWMKESPLRSANRLTPLKALQTYEKANKNHEDSVTNGTNDGKENTPEQDSVFTDDDSSMLLSKVSEDNKNSSTQKRDIRSHLDEKNNANISEMSSRTVEDKIEGGEEKPLLLPSSLSPNILRDKTGPGSSSSESSESGEEVPAWRRELEARRQSRPLVPALKASEAVYPATANVPQWKRDLIEKRRHRKESIPTISTTEKEEKTAVPPWQQELAKRKKKTPILPHYKGEAEKHS